MTLDLRSLLAASEPNASTDPTSPISETPSEATETDRHAACAAETVRIALTLAPHRMFGERGVTGALGAPGQAPVFLETTTVDELLPALNRTFEQFMANFTLVEPTQNEEVTTTTPEAALVTAPANKQAEALSLF